MSSRRYSTLLYSIYNFLCFYLRFLTSCFEIQFFTPTHCSFLIFLFLLLLLLFLCLLSLLRPKTIVFAGIMFMLIVVVFITNCAMIAKGKEHKVRSGEGRRGTRKWDQTKRETASSHAKPFRPFQLVCRFVSPSLT